MSAKLGQYAFLLSWLIILQGCETTYRLYDRDTPRDTIVFLVNGGLMGPDNKYVTSGIAIVENIDGKSIFDKSVFELSEDKWGSFQRLMISPGHHDLSMRFYGTRTVYGPVDAKGNRIVTEHYALSLKTKTLSFEAKPKMMYFLLAWGSSSATDPKWDETWYVWIQERPNPFRIGPVVAGESPPKVQRAIEDLNEYWRKKGKGTGRVPSAEDAPSWARTSVAISR